MFRALGNGEPPVEIVIDGQKYQRVTIFKHDSWAATALYQSAERTIVCKFNRRQGIGLFSMEWLGRRLARRERRILTLLAGLPSVPGVLGPVMVAGKPLENAVAHDYVPGHPLRAGEQVNDEFFPRLKSLLKRMHDRGIAYVDLHKRENIIVGDDGWPYLIDFQISGAWPEPHPFGLEILNRFLLSVLKTCDDYHLAKHIRNCRPDQAGAVVRPWWIRLHRLVAVPFRSLRRRVLVMLGIRKGRGQADSEHFPEDAVRQSMAA
jgi:tRNA A-37 threonylcarbamoyl transferase component Bud32